ncbi:hypothetical protein K474DRAFT_1662031 [Panus rudis PR-1116 ss-1]|nr:hypothetical protein K474DRAFT_1662031 [Panus rudis PR-1116 ss-1]
MFSPGTEFCRGDENVLQTSRELSRANFYAADTIVSVLSAHTYTMPQLGDPLLILPWYFWLQRL